MFSAPLRNLFDIFILRQEQFVYAEKHKQNKTKLFPEGPAFKWFVIQLEILKLEIH